MKTQSLIITLILTMFLVACGKSLPLPENNAPALPPVGMTEDDGAVVHGRAMVTVTSEQQSSLAKLFQNFLMAKSYAASSGSSVVTYTNAPATSFSINAGSLAAGSFSGLTLSLGSVALSALSDNNLKVCGGGGNTKCTQAVIRVYTSGSISGFVNTDENYGVPLHAGSLNPSANVGLLAAGSVQVQTLSIANSKHIVGVADFPSPSYAVSADFSNGGAGPYSMTFVLEYALLP